MEISYPVFFLGNKKPTTVDGVTFYHYLYEKDEVVREVIKIVDDKSIPGDSIGLRRLRLKAEGGADLYIMGTAIYLLNNLVKHAASGKWYIDNLGKVFTYKKTTRASLEFRKITRIIKNSSGGCILEVDGIPGRFKTLYEPLESERYAGMLKYGIGYILYGLYDRMYDNTWRMV